jgi:hypothetical protein
MINSTRDAPTLREQRIRQVLIVVPAALAIIVCAVIPAVRAAENYTQSVAQNAPPPSAPHMTAAEKERALTEFMRRDAAGEKIDPALFKAFMEAQNEGATTGIAIGQTAPAFQLKDQNGRTHTLKSLMGRKGGAAGFHPQRRLVTLLPSAARRAAAFGRRVRKERPRTGLDKLRFARGAGRLRRRPPDNLAEA